MPRDSNGNTNPLPGTIVNQGDTILPSQHNPALVDLYAMMTQSLSRDGQGGMRSNLAMNGFQITGLGSATQPGSAVPLSQFQSGTPVGAVVDFAGITPPDTWLLCFGQAVEVSAYPEFVAACYVGNALNATAGFGYRTTSQTDPSANRSTSGQFIVLPDFRDRVSVGKGNMGGVSSGRVDQSLLATSLIGSSGGLDKVALSNSEMPSHNHGGVVASNGEHTHTGLTIPVSATLGPGPGTVQSNGNAGTPTLAGVMSGGAHVHTISSDGGGSAHNNMQPSLVTNKIIKVSY